MTDAMTVPDRDGAAPPGPRFTPRDAATVLAVRLGLVLGGAAVAWLLLRQAPGPVIGTLVLLPVNVICLVLVLRLYRSRGVSFAGALGVRRGRVLRDIGWGLLWLVVLNVPFMATIMGVMWLLYGGGMFEAFATVFAGEPEALAFAPAAALAIGIVVVVAFAPLNAPTEELVYRGVAQSGLANRIGAPLAIVAQALAFGLQHIAFATSPGAMLVYGTAFFVWGALAGIVVRVQGRLLPVVVAHLVINLLTSAPALVFPILQLAGAVP